jgi:hypothetical protein
MEDGDAPVTEALLKTELTAMEDRLIEFMRTLETNVLTAFHGTGKGSRRACTMSKVPNTR